MWGEEFFQTEGQGLRVTMGKWVVNYKSNLLNNYKINCVFQKFNIMAPKLYASKVADVAKPIEDVKADPEKKEKKPRTEKQIGNMSLILAAFKKAKEAREKNLALKKAEIAKDIEKKNNQTGEEKKIILSKPEPSEEKPKKTRKRKPKMPETTPVEESKPNAAIPETAEQTETPKAVVAKKKVKFSDSVLPSPPHDEENPPKWFTNWFVSLKKGREANDVKKAREEATNEAKEKWKDSQVREVCTKQAVKSNTDLFNQVFPNRRY